MNELTKALAVTCELTGTTLSAGAKEAFVLDLAQYPLQQVLSALARCRREVRGRLTVSDVVSRLDDGRPGVEEAWAMLPKDEDASVVWSQEMATAFGVALPLIEHDPIAARMAFKEAYTAAIQRARDEGKPVKWSLSQGHEKSGRALAVREALERGRLTRERARLMLENIGPEYVEQHARALEGPQPIAGLLDIAPKRLKQDDAA